MERPLHKLLTYRLNDDGTVNQKMWFGHDQTKGIPYPSHFKYETAVVKRTRVWWTQGYDPKWYLQPWPLTEVNKGYGLLQNPGW